MIPEKLMVSSIRKPLLKWAGGKTFLVPKIASHWLRYNLECGKESRLVEPFAGSLAMAIGLNPEQALLNDFNFHVFNLYRWIKAGLQAPITPVNSEFVFYEYRHLFNELARSSDVGSRRAAFLFYYLNRTCYRGLCRFNQSGEFNTPYGRYKTINYIEDFNEFRKIIIGWEFTNLDFSAVKTCSSDFIYADPPYDTPFAAFTKESFSWRDQIRVAEWLNEQAKKGCKIIASNQDTPRVFKLYKSMNFRIERILGPRRISAVDRTAANELLMSRNI